MTVRFDTWVEADSIQEAWGKLVYLMSQIADWGKLKAQNEFSATILEDGAEDKANIKGELTVRELQAFCISTMNEDCSLCPLYNHEHGYYCSGRCPIYSHPYEWDIEELTSIVRGYKPEGEEEE